MDSLFGPKFNMTVGGTSAKAGTYNNITVTTAGALNLSGNLVVTGTLTVQAGGKVNTNCHTISGSGNFVMQGNTTLNICDANGISNNPNTGAIQVTGTREFASSVNFTFNGSSHQSTGNGMPSQVNNLILSNSAGVALTNALAVSGNLTLTAGNFDLQGNNLTLLSSKTGTASLTELPSGSSLLNAGNVTVQRWLDSAAVRRETAGYGAYYWVGTPVSGQTVDLWNTSANPYVSSSYDGLTAHGSVWLYSNTDNTTPANGGWIKPSDASVALNPGSGARVWFNNAFFAAGGVAAATATPVTGTANLPVSYCNGTCAGNTATNGWNLLANPYPATIDWNNSNWTKNNIADAVYVWRHKLNAYASYANPISVNGGSNLIASGQGFMVEATDAAPVRTAVEKVKSTSAAPVLRSSAISLLRLNLASATHGSDEAVVADRAGSRRAFEPATDARKFYNPGVSLFFEPVAGNPQSIASFELAPSDSVSLKLFSYNAASVTLTATDFSDLESRYNLFIRDERTGTVTPLNATTALHFNLSAGNAYPLTVLFSPLHVTGIAGVSKFAFSVQPNPSKGAFSITGTAELKQLDITDNLGRSVYSQAVSGTACNLYLNLPAGVYTAKVTGLAGTAVSRLVIE